MSFRVVVVPHPHLLCIAFSLSYLSVFRCSTALRYTNLTCGQSLDTVLWLNVSNGFFADGRSREVAVFALDVPILTDALLEVRGRRHGWSRWLVWMVGWCR
jgi:hypothetical protein